MRELREFRVHHEDFLRQGITVAGVTRDTPESNRTWSARLQLPYPLLSDREGTLGEHFGVVRRVGIGSWGIEFFQRSTFLVDSAGIVAAAWTQVHLRGHAREVLEVAKTLSRHSAEAG